MPTEFRLRLRLRRRNCLSNDFFPGFGFGHRGFGQVSATAVSGTWFPHAAVGRQPYCPSRHWSGSGFVIWPMSRRPSASGHTLNMLQLISLSCLNRPRRSRTVAPSPMDPPLVWRWPRFPRFWCLEWMKHSIIDSVSVVAETRHKVSAPASVTAV